MIRVPESGSFPDGRPEAASARCRDGRQLSVCSPANGATPSDFGGVACQPLREHRRFEGRLADPHAAERAVVAVDGSREQRRHVRRDHQRNAPGDRLVGPLARGAAGRLGGDDGVQFLADQQSLGRGDEAGSRRQIRHAEHIAEAAPLVGGEGGDAEPALHGRIDAGGEHREKVVAAPAALLGGGLGGDRVLELADQGAGVVDADLEPTPRAAGDQGAQRRGEAAQRGRNAGLMLAEHDRRLERSDAAHQARQRPHHAVRADIVPVRTALAEPADRDNIELRVGRAQGGLAGGTGVVPGARPGVDQNVDSAGDLRQPSGIVGRDGDAALVGVQPGEQRALTATAAGINHRRHPAVCIAARRLDLENVGAEIGKQLAAVGQRPPAPEFRDAHAAERRLAAHAFVHGRSPSAIVAAFRGVTASAGLNGRQFLGLLSSAVDERGADRLAGLSSEYEVEG